MTQEEKDRLIQIARALDVLDAWLHTNNPTVSLCILEPRTGILDLAAYGERIYQGLLEIALGGDPAYLRELRDRKERCGYQRAALTRDEDALCQEQYAARQEHQVSPGLVREIEHVRFALGNLHRAIASLAVDETRYQYLLAVVSILMQAFPVEECETATTQKAPCLRAVRAIMVADAMERGDCAILARSGNGSLGMTLKVDEFETILPILANGGVDRATACDILKNLTAVPRLDGLMVPCIQTMVQTQPLFVLSHAAPTSVSQWQPPSDAVPLHERLTVAPDTLHALFFAEYVPPASLFSVDNPYQNKLAFACILYAVGSGCSLIDLVQHDLFPNEMHEEQERLESFCRDIGGRCLYAALHNRSGDGQALGQTLYWGMQALCTQVHTLLRACPEDDLAMLDAYIPVLEVAAETLLAWELDLDHTSALTCGFLYAAAIDANNRYRLHYGANQECKNGKACALECLTQSRETAYLLQTLVKWRKASHRLAQPERTQEMIHREITLQHHETIQREMQPQLDERTKAIEERYQEAFAMMELCQQEHHRRQSSFETHQMGRSMKRSLPPGDPSMMKKSNRKMNASLGIHNAPSLSPRVRFGMSMPSAQLTTSEKKQILANAKQDLIAREVQKRMDDADTQKAIHDEVQQRLAREQETIRTRIFHETLDALVDIALGGILWAAHETTVSQKRLVAMYDTYRQHSSIQAVAGMLVPKTPISDSEHGVFIERIPVDVFVHHNYINNYTAMKNACQQCADAYRSNRAKKQPIKESPPPMP